MPPHVNDATPTANGPRKHFSTITVRRSLRAPLCAGACGKPALPALLGRSNQSRWAKWLLGRPLQRALHSGALSDRGPGLVLGPRRFYLIADFRLKIADWK